MLGFKYYVVKFCNCFETFQRKTSDDAALPHTPYSIINFPYSYAKKPIALDGNDNTIDRTVGTVEYKDVMKRCRLRREILDDDDDDEERL